MKYCLNYSGTRILFTGNWNYSISWRILNLFRIYARLTTLPSGWTGPCCSKDGSDPSTWQISIQWIEQLIPNTCLLNSDLSLAIGWRYPAFVQQAPVLYFYLLLTWSVCLTSLVCSLTPSDHFYCNFFPSKQKLYWRCKKSTNKECCIGVVPDLLKKKKKKKKKHFTLDLNGSPVQVFPSPVNPALHVHA